MDIIVIKTNIEKSIDRNLVNTTTKKILFSKLKLFEPKYHGFVIDFEIYR